MNQPATGKQFNLVKYSKNIKLRTSSTHTQNEIKKEYYNK